MTHRIFKYESPDMEQHSVQEKLEPVPFGAQILSLSPQTGCIYCRVDDAQPTTQMLHTVVFGTGNDTKGVKTKNYLGLYHSGPFVWHVFAWIED